MSGSKRNSSVELLKVVAIILIVLCHSLPNKASGVGSVDISMATTNWQVFTMFTFHNLGMIGNVIFVCCSAWFLLDTSSVKGDKIAMMIGDCFFLSLAWLLGSLLGGYHLETSVVLKQFFPFTLSTYWFLNCYVLLYALHPYLNKVIDGISEKSLLTFDLIFIVIYCVLQTLKAYAFFYSDLIGFIGIYFIVAYVKRYVVSEKEKNHAMKSCLWIGVFGYAITTLMLNVVGLKVGFFANQMELLNKITNPFYILIAIGLLLMALKHTFYNGLVNYISSLSLIIYMIHTNTIMRNYYRFEIFGYIEEQYTFNHILLWVLIYFVINLIVSIALAALYNKTLQRGVHYVAKKIGELVGRLKELMECGIILLLKGKE